MKAFFAGIKRWWLRRRHGIVKPPAQYGGQGTTWQQHARHVVGFTCRNCRTVLAFTEEDFVIRSQAHLDDCTRVLAPEFIAKVEQSGGWMRCSCPITDARNIKICPQCGMGHWQDATPQKRAS